MKKIISLIVALAFALNVSHAQTLDWTISNHTHISQVDTTVVTAPPVGSGSTTTTSDSAFKMTIWMHGLAGGISSWNHVKAVTEQQVPGQMIAGYPPRQTDGINLDYSPYETGTLIAAADAMNDDIGIWEQSKNYDTLNIARKLAIAHSQGGHLARWMRYLNYTSPQQNPARFGALITIGTPHNGAALINNSSPSSDKVQAWLTDGCQSLFKVRFDQSLQQLPWYVNWVLDEPSLASEMSKYLCMAFNNTVLPLAISKVRRPIAASYAVGDSILASSNTFSSSDTISTLVVYGVEQEPVLWRTMHSMTGALKNNTMSGSTLFDNPFGLNSDVQLANDMMNQSSFYIATAALYSAISSHWLTSSLLWLGNSLQQTRNREQNYRNAALWIRNANANWKRLIGARYDSIVNLGYVCYCDNQPMDTVANSIDCSYLVDNCPFTRILQANELFAIDLPSDGIVTVQSQKAYPGNNAYPPLRMNNTNHMQMRNSSETKRVLRSAFNGAYGDDFKIGQQ